MPCYDSFQAFTTQLNAYVRRARAIARIEIEVKLDFAPLRAYQQKSLNCVSKKTSSSLRSGSFEPYLCIKASIGVSFYEVAKIFRGPYRVNNIPIWGGMRLLFIVFLCLIMNPCYAHEAAQGAVKPRPVVLVSVAPYKRFVETIAAGTIDVALMVPAGTSSHTFEPSPKQMLTASHADIWFQIGEGFEERAGRALKSYNPHMSLVDMREGLDLITCAPDEGCHCAQHVHASCIDPHFWMSPTEVKKQVHTITRALQQRYPQNQKLYESKAQELITQLDVLDKEIKELMSSSKGQVVMVSHPAYGYFCRDYLCRQLSIEFEGKDPTPRELTRILTEARQQRIQKVFIQMQYNSKGARLLAKELGAQIVVLDPYAEDYFNSMREIARQFAQKER
jgi:zinc transport system substrate-binding protein